MARKQNLLGFRFGRLLVVARHQGRYWQCECECGEGRVVASDKLKSGHTASCGCLRRERLTARSTKHGGGRRGVARDPEYIVWRNMKSRCSNPSNPSYRNYGGRGITVCQSWLADYAAFLSDMGRRPSPKHTLERVNNDGPYTPGNCRWATRLEQKHNQRQRKDAVLVGGAPIKQLAEALGIPYRTALWRFRKYGRID